MFSRTTISTRTRAILTSTILTALGAPALADIHNYGGGVYAGVESNPPSNMDLSLNGTEDDTRFHAYCENWRIPFQAGTPFQANLPGFYNDVSDYTPGVIPIAAGTPVNAYLFHFDPTSGIPAKDTTGWVEFTRPIWVIAESSSLDNTDNYYGYLGVQYPRFLNDREWDVDNFVGVDDWFHISQPSAGIWRLEVYAHAGAGMDQLRIIELPTPSSLALLGLGGLVTLRRRRG